MNNARGVITLCDKKAEWMLTHWMKAFRAHNPDMPVTLIDSGCTHKPLAEFREMGKALKDGTVNDCELQACKKEIRDAVEALLRAEKNLEARAMRQRRTR